jgi:hypothetical protein
MATIREGTSKQHANAIKSTRMHAGFKPTTRFELKMLPKAVQKTHEHRTEDKDELRERISGVTLPLSNPSPPGSGESIPSSGDGRTGMGGPRCSSGGFAIRVKPTSGVGMGGTVRVWTGQVSGLLHAHPRLYVAAV